MDRTVRAVLEGDEAAPGRVAAVDVARLVLGVQAALRRAAHVVLGRPKRTSAGRYEAAVERATRLRFVRIEEGSFAGVMALPDHAVDQIEPDMGLEVSDLGYLAWQRLLDVVQASSDDIDPALAYAVAQLADDVNLGGRTSRIRLESIGEDEQPHRYAVIDESTRHRMRAASARPEPQQDIVHGRLVEADFERHSARLRLPTGEAVIVTFTDDLAGEIQAALREPGTFVGDVDYRRGTGQASRVRLRQVVPTGEQLQLFGEFHQHRTVEELATEQGVAAPQQIDDLRTEITDVDELAAFVACAEQS